MDLGNSKRPDNGPLDGLRNRPASKASWKIFAAVVAGVAVLVLLTDTHPFADNAVTNTPASTPPSTQRPDKTLTVPDPEKQ